MRTALHQTAEQTAIFPLSLYERITPLNLASRKIWIDDTNNTHHIALTNNDSLLCIEEDIVVLKAANNTVHLGNANMLLRCTYRPNMLSAVAVAHTLNMPFSALTTLDIAVEHRLEKVCTTNGITFYNDSKATVAESTTAALTHFKHENTVLLLGGLSKGVDRAPFIRSLSKEIKKIICFGKEAHALHTVCVEQGIPSAEFETLEPAFMHAVAAASSGDIVLLSPAGSSYDLYADYTKRGEHFKQLINSLSGLQRQEKKRML